MNKQHVGPAPSERALLELWDTIDRERAARGEQHAAIMARRALAAAQPPQETTKNDNRPSNSR